MYTSNVLCNESFLQFITIIQYRIMYTSNDSFVITIDTDPLIPSSLCVFVSQKKEKKKKKKKTLITVYQSNAIWVTFCFKNNFLVYYCLLMWTIGSNCLAGKKKCDDSWITASTLHQHWLLKKSCDNSW